MLRFAKKFYTSLIQIGQFLQSFVLLATRLFWGWEFFAAGRGKLSNINPVIEFFHELGIPFPTLNAYTAASIECVGGICLIIGFASRLVSLPLMIVMVVAMLTAHHDAVVTLFDDPQNFVEQLPFNFFLTSLLIFTFGPGAISLDAVLQRLFFKNGNKI